jgi:hypothetical protein
MNGASPSMDARIHYDQVLLIHPLGYSGEIAKYDISRMANIMPPLGLASIAAYLKKKRVAVTIVDCYAKPDSDEFIKDFLIEVMQNGIDNFIDNFKKKLRDAASGK